MERDGVVTPKNAKGPATVSKFAHLPPNCARRRLSLAEAVLNVVGTFPGRRCRIVQVFACAGQLPVDENAVLKVSLRLTLLTDACILMVRKVHYGMGLAFDVRASPGGLCSSTYSVMPLCTAHRKIVAYCAL